MSDDINIDLPDDAPDWAKNLRKQYDSIRAENATLKKDNGDLTKKVRVTSVADILKSKNVNPKVAGLIPADVDPSDEGITNWLKEFGDVFGVAAEQEDQGADPDEVAAFAAAQNAGHDSEQLSVGSRAELERMQTAYTQARNLNDFAAAVNGGTRR